MKSGKTTASLLNKLLQDELRPRFAGAVEKLYVNDYSSPPFATLVDITTKCNLNCPWCIDQYALSDKEIPTKRMLTLLEEFKDLNILSIVYFGGGEPLFHEGVKEILEKTQRLEIDYALNTNGILLHRALSVIAESCSWSRVSWDAADPVVYREMHRNMDLFGKILENTEDLAKHAKGTVGVSFVVMQANIGEIHKAAKLVKNIGCNFVQFKPRYTPLESNKRVLDYYDDETSTIVKEELVKAQEEENDNFAVLITGSLKAVLDKKPINQNKTYTYCAAQQFITLINPCGVYICPNWRGAQGKSVGNVLTNSLAKIWQSQKRREVINSLNPSKECELNCLRHDTNVLISALLRAKSMGLDLLSHIQETRGEEISDRYFL